MNAQTNASSSELLNRLQKLQNRASILYIAAHPDDENTRLIAYMANEWNADVTYLSLTRGDGGQNLIGPELREELGIIRTQELLQARSIDGGKQRFTRANDFGYSKHHDETLQIWQKEEVLSDVVRIIRQTKPHIIITRFDSTGGHTHGHHTASAKLALEAFNLAADANAFKEHNLAPWKAAAIYWNAYSWRGVSEEVENHPDLIKIDMGGKNPLLPYSYSEISAHSRTQHKSQGFGSSPQYGAQIEYLVPWKNAITEEAFHRLGSRNWENEASLAPYHNLLRAIISSYDSMQPAKSVMPLLELKNLLANDPKIPDELRMALTQEMDSWVADALGIHLQFRSRQAEVVEGEPVQVELLAALNDQKVNADLRLKAISMSDSDVETELSSFDESRQILIEHTIELKVDPMDQSPYWLRKQGSTGLYAVEEASLIGLPEKEPSLTAVWEFEYRGHSFQVQKTLHHYENDPVKGLLVSPVKVLPVLEIKPEEELVIYRKGQEASIVLNVIKHVEEPLEVLFDLSGSAAEEVLNVPKVTILQAGKGVVGFEFALKPNSTNDSIRDLSFSLKLQRRGRTLTYAHHLKSIEYDHISPQFYMIPAKVKLVELDVETAAEKLLYIEGAGDLVPEALAKLGVEVTQVQPADATAIDFEAYQAIMIGIRAYNVNPGAMSQLQEKLNSYMQKGGVVITQYNTLSRDLPEALGPYSLEISRNRVTDEFSPVEILDENHPAMRFPNQISLTDFEGWVQERGLYFPAEWDTRYVPLLSMQDPKEEPLRGSLLVAAVGEGYHVYTGLSFFRELPAGVPGAYRLMANLISLGAATDE